MRQAILLACQACQLSLCVARASSAPLPFLPLPFLGPSPARGNSALSSSKAEGKLLETSRQPAARPRARLLFKPSPRGKTQRKSNRRGASGVFAHSTEDDELRFAVHHHRLSTQDCSLHIILYPSACMLAAIVINSLIPYLSSAVDPQWSPVAHSLGQE